MSAVRQALRNAAATLGWEVARALLRVLPSRVIRLLLTEWSRHPSEMDRAGFHLRRFAFSEPLPEFAALASRDFERPRSCHGLDWQDKVQAELLARISLRADELDTLEAEAAPFRFDNGYYGGSDAAALYLLLRELRPRRLVEVGSGFSTLIAQAALRRNERDGAAPAEHLCIEPFPNARTTGLGNGVEFLRVAAEDAPEEAYLSLRTGDVLFIDSSHTVRAFGDVCHLLLDVLPRLPAGTWVHVHDIFLPWEYPREWIIGERRAWAEQYLLEALLYGNPGWEPALMMHRLHRARPPSLRDARLRDGIGHVPTAFWMRRRGGKLPQ